ncbi:MAG TPA: DUF3574 domain-containing protein [Actinophytocola sp.]|uniref:DUF3574 domain-containing protein n=1 Tax=Actinophytocola sp. TaxID=1872138 RepID=UPI002DDD0499|nr:DUF3574 domain-containing protein [Actinophytocola sp.]HEV2784163.1 DUF3574 domain-containing protein [Actinophytocola sp.]
MSKLTSAKLAIVAPLVAVLGLTTAATTTAAQPRQEPAAAVATAAAPGRLWHRTELYFGLSRPGGEVTEQEFQQFVDVEVTKRFPDGLTLLSGQGQFQGGNGVVIKERSKLLILLYPLTDRAADGEIEEIRRAYKDRFEQESVLRVDALERVSF